MLQEAVILAGGFGTRLKEAVSDVPKPMAPVNGKPFLDYILKYLTYYRIKKVVLSVGYLSEKIIEHYGSSFGDIEIVYAIEKEPLGTGGGIKMAMQQCSSADILVMNGDSFFDIDLHSFYDKHSDSISECSLALRHVSHAGRYGTITLGEFDMIQAFKEKTNVNAPGIINAGVYLLGRQAYNEETPRHPSFSIEKEFFEKKLNQLNMYGFTYNDYFIDIGIPEDYKQAQHDFKTFKY
jgi:D-glycero-alpha-D-manno-heptose 1-phosphate guanylyltransferase